MLQAITTKTCLILGLLWISGNVSAQAQSQTYSTSCKARAYVTDQDAQGLNVRLSNNSKSTVLGKLPLYTEVSVFAEQDDWLLISPLSPELQGVAFHGKGWVYASLLGLSTKGYDRKSVSLYAQPNQESPVTAHIPSNSSVTLLGCSGEWVLVKQKNITGWLEPAQQCSAAVTTCS
jgi:SH3-like domain-containing protein